MTIGTRKVIVSVVGILLPLTFALQRQQAQSMKNLPAMNGPIMVGPNVHVSKTFSNISHGETYLAADPNNPDNLLGGVMLTSQRPDQPTVVAYASSDGGKTWRPALTLNQYDGYSDPAAAFGPDGSAYFCTITSIGYPEMKTWLDIHSSKDNGKTWLTPTRLQFLDRPYIVVDDTGGKYQGRIYVTGHKGGFPGIDSVSSPDAVSVYRSTDGGRTFETPVHLVATPDQPIRGVSKGVILSDGTLVLAYIQGKEGTETLGSQFKPNFLLKVVSSEVEADNVFGAIKFSKASVISNITFGHSLTSGPSVFDIAADRSTSAFKDRLYAVWANTYSGGSDIMLSYSSDKGKSWTAPRVVNDDVQPFDPANRRDHFRPVVAVNRDGVVGVMWYDRRNSTNNLDWEVRFAASLDGGDTFLPSVKVSEGAFTHDKEKQRFEVLVFPSHPRQQRGVASLDLAVSPFFLHGGHTTGLAADAAARFHPFWVDNRTGVSQVWTALVTVSGKPVRNGSPELADLDDISNKVFISSTTPQYDPATGNISFAAQVQNVSKETITGPVKIRVLSVASPAGGAVKIRSADNGETAVSAVWDFSQLLSDNQLKPGEKSGIKHLEFSVTNLPSLEEALRVGRPGSLRGTQGSGGSWGALMLARFEIKVFAKIKKP